MIVQPKSLIMLTSNPIMSIPIVRILKFNENFFLERSYKYLSLLKIPKRENIY